ncbi:MAG TPA: TetR/AcrR family transcriptional regulator [Symbiobacteriaceae bacterium]|jgi:AcrR family transcriptional regulator
MNEQGPTGRERRHARTRQAILEIALELSNESGLEELSLREIARRADFSPAGLYRYFESKEDIVAALAADATRLLTDHLNSVPTNLHPRERLIRLGLAYLTFAGENPAHFRLLFSDLPAGRSSLSEPVPANSPYAILLDAVQEAIKSGDVVVPGGDDGAEAMAFAIWSLVHGMALLKQVHLRTFDANFDAIYRHALERMVGTHGRT